MAKERNIDTIAITDHSTTSGIQEAKAAGKENDVKIVPGIELVSSYGGIKFHLLGLFIDETAAQLKSMMFSYHAKRAKLMISLLKELEKMGIPIPKSRSAIELSMIKLIKFYGTQLPTEQAKRIVCAIKHTNQYKSLNQLAIPFDYASGVIHKSCGLAVIPHLSRLPMIEQDQYEFVSALKEIGLDGIETCHPEYAKEQIEFYSSIADQMKLFKTGGSDYHGKNPGVVELGQCVTPVEHMKKMEEISQTTYNAQQSISCLNASKWRHQIRHN